MPENEGEETQSDSDGEWMEIWKHKKKEIKIMKHNKMTLNSVIMTEVSGG